MIRLYIYFARRTDGEGPIKIGCSSAPIMRVRQLGFDLSLPISVIAQAPGDFTMERNLHFKFRDVRAACPKRAGRAYIGGQTEWFEATPEVLRFIATVQRTGKIPIPDTQRLEVIFAARYRAGETLRSIAADYGISHERVRQILKAHGCSTARKIAA